MICEKVVFLGFSIIAKNASQKSQGITRGGRIINLGSGAAGENAINTGGLLTYVVPEGKKAKIKGNISVTNYGANLFVEVEVFDNSSGRLIPVVRLTAAQNEVSKPFEMEIVHILPALRQEVQIHGDNAANNGTAQWFASIEELPA